jgi:serine/threonine protein kinase
MIANKYRLLEKINEGSFGLVYKAENIRTGEKLAMKVEKKSGNNVTTTLKTEAKIYQYLDKLNGFPQLKWFGTDNEYNYLAIDLYLFSLNTIVKTNKIINIETVLFFGKQMIERIETLHSKLLLHRDIKPANFLVDGTNKLFLIDFGMCKRYDHDGKHISKNEIKSIIGTVNYVSLNVHKGIEPSRRDDLESCIYIMVYMLFGKLDWDTCVSNDVIVLLKKDLVVNTKLPSFLIEMLIYIRQLKFDEKPDYNLLFSIIDGELIRFS